jgi:hypothetical protein
MIPHYTLVAQRAANGLCASRLDPFTRRDGVHRRTRFVPSERFPPLSSVENPCKSSKADARIRTADPFITSEVLYQLSYVGGEASIASGFFASCGSTPVCRRPFYCP